MPVITDAVRAAEQVCPAGAPVMRQCWDHLLFLHWSWAPEAVQRTLPPGLTVDTHDGRAWIGVVPFFMRRVRPRGLPAVPGISDFLELNVRTYVTDARGRPGVWFYSLDANQWLAVKIARGLFHLPYQHALMRAEVGADGALDYRSQRRGDAHEGIFRWRRKQLVAPAAAGTLEFFLVERYRLFAHDVRHNELWSGRVHHAPYQIAEAELAGFDDRVLTLAGFDRAERPPEHVCAGQAVDVGVWPMERLPAAGG